MELIAFPESIEPFAIALGLSIFVYLAIELAWLHFGRGGLKLREARTAGLGVAVIAIASALVASIGLPIGVALFATVGADVAPVESQGWGVAGWVYGWLVYEFWYWVQHWAAHKVRLLWCIHSPHHAPESLHMLIGANHHVLESVVYMPFFAGFVPALMGVDPLVCLGLNLVDSVWGSFLHVSDDVVRRGRYGVLGRFLQTPAHHRVHHARNVGYLDRNYCSITLFWDWVFRTLEPLRDAEPAEYGVSRRVDTGSFWDVHFGEFAALWRDVRGASTWADRVGYLLRPPGWRPGDPSRTAGARRAAFLKSNPIGASPITALAADRHRPIQGGRP